ncbi:DUF1833 family protein [Treponema pectinovorum]|uniref:DUF1833 family protein n=1 Tax=Treponema pectinovorum TaxID=164 RepID=UPI0011C86355|nr:DUF1833 family protein [Treponema pectinovorum]
MPDISKKAIEAVTAEETQEVFLTILKIYVDDSVFIRIVNDNQNLTIKGEEYFACAFTAILPDQTGDGNKNCRLQIDNTDVSIYKIIKSSIGHKVTCDIAVVLSSSPEIYECGPFNFVLRNISADKNAITADLYDLYIQDRKATVFTYSPQDFPGMYF